MRKVLVLAAGLAVAGSVAVAAPVFAAAPRLPVVGGHPAWATPQARIADTAPNSRLTFRVYLRSRDAAGAEATTREVSDPRSPHYRKFLSPQEVHARFGPLPSTVDGVRGWLTGAGFTLGDVPANDAYLEATGTADQVQQAFGTRLGEYRVGDRTVRAAASALTLPGELASQIVGVVGVDESMRLVRPAHTTGDAATDAALDGTTAPASGTIPPPAGFRNAAPCSPSWGAQVDTTDPAFAGAHLPYAPCGLNPAQLRTAYGVQGAVQSGNDGHGTTVAIVDAFFSSTIYDDAAKYAVKHDPAHPLRTDQFNQYLFTPNPAQEPADKCDASGWQSEEALDVEATHAVAPGANILYVGASDCQDPSLDKAVNQVVAGRQADVVSNSYYDMGENADAGVIRSFESIAQPAAMEGISLLFCSGDSGDEVGRLGHPSADFWASSPWVTAVGGTSLGVDAEGHKLVETGWEDGKSVLTNGSWTPGQPPGTFASGSGGGTSVAFTQPYYQAGVVPDALATQNQQPGVKGRVEPDVSAIADPSTGFEIGFTQQFPDGTYYDEWRIGGTSLATPVVAALTALADQHDGTPYGFLNPLLYGAGRGQLADVQHVGGLGVVRLDYNDKVDAAGGTTTSLRTFDFPNETIHTTAGYDNVTGLGTFNGSPTGPASTR